MLSLVFLSYFCNILRQIRLGLLIIVIFLNTILSAQEAIDIKYTRYDIEDGLSQNNVFRITQDSIGYIWIATSDGVNRFDGYNFTVYNSKNGLLDEVGVTGLLCDSKNRIWVGGKELSLFDRLANRFITFPNTNVQDSGERQVIRDILADYKGNLWIIYRNKVISHFNMETQKFSNYYSFPLSDHNIPITVDNKIYIDHENKLWIGKSQLLYMDLQSYYQSHTWCFNRLLSQEKLDWKVPGESFVLYSDSKSIWIGDNLIHYNRNTKKLSNAAQYSKDRLRAVPHATLSIEAKQQGIK